MKVRKSLFFKRFIALGFLCTLFTMRGMILGNVASNAGIVISLILMFISMTLKRRRSVDIRILLSCFAFFSYCVFQGMMISNQRSFVIYVGFLWLVEVGMAYVVLDDYDTQTIVCRMLIILLVFMTVSYIITLAGAIIFGWSSLRLTTLNLNYTFTYPLFFPLTTTYGSGHVFGMEFYRLLGFARESGIMQCFYIWGYFKIDTFFESHQKLFKLLMILGVGFCLSATGIILFVSTLLISILSKKITKVFSWRTLFIILIVIVAVTLMLSDSEYGFAYRYLFSYQDRRVAIESGLKELASAPVFGTGFLRDTGLRNVQSDICFLSSVGSIGIIGALFFTATFIQGYMRASNKKEFLTSTGPFFVTTLLAQPLYYSPLIYLFLFVRSEKHRV